MADNFVEIAKQFCDFYYQQFDADRKQLGPLYRDQSMLTYESSSVQGVNAIVEKLSVRSLLLLWDGLGTLGHVHLESLARAVSRPSLREYSC